MPTNRARPNAKRDIPMVDAKERVIDAIRDGLQVKDAMQLVGRAAATYIDWRKEDKQFAERIDQVREIARAARLRGHNGGRPEVPDFPEFCDRYLGMPLPEHHLRVWDVLNGRDPRSMHPAIRYQVGRSNRVLLNFPPFHAKTQVWSVNYCVWRMMKDPNVRICVLSKTQEFAKKIVHQIKQILALPQYAKLHAAFMPEGGWKGDGWTKTQIYLSGVDQAQNDPTLQALGLQGQIYGSRLDVVIIDDTVDSKNVHTYEAMADYVGTEVASRVDDSGILICLGTRMAPHDLYAELRDLREWDDETPIWTYFAQPAVFDMPEPHPDSWITLWPEKWPGLALARAKAEVKTDARWQLTYQQMDASIDQVFPTGAVLASIDGSRAAGPMPGLHCVLGVDPAADGYTAMIVLGVDRATGRRYLLDGFNMAKCPPELLIHKIKYFVEKYRCREVVCERNAFQGFLTRQLDLREFCYAQGCLLTEHYTGAKKWDDDLGVSSMAPWFMSCGTHDPATDKWTKRPTEFHQISLPNPKFATFVDQLVTQLTTWQPRSGKQHTLTDLVMALWFASIGVQKVLDQQRNVPRHLDNPFISRADRATRQVVNLHELMERQLRGEHAAN